MAVILSMLASVSGEITTGTLLISPVGSSSAMTISAAVCSRHGTRSRSQRFQERGQLAKM